MSDNDDVMKAMNLLIETIVLNDKPTAVWVAALFATIAGVYHEQGMSHELYMETVKEAAEHYKTLWE